MSSLTVILPAAGEGKRLGLPFPKELYEVLPGRALIDFSLDHIQTFFNSGMGQKIELKVAVVICDGKEAIVDHVRTALPNIPVKTCYFDTKYDEWPGSVLSAGDQFSSRNIVLLPDSYLEVSKVSPWLYPDGATLISRTMESLETRQVVFGVHPTTDPEVLTRLGAVRYNESMEITHFQDKPHRELERYNGIWSFYGFRQSAAQPLYEFLIRSVNHESVSIDIQPFHPAGVVPVAAYRDLGEWTAIHAFKQTRK